MAKVEIDTHINCHHIYDRLNEFKDVELFFEELVTGESESRINHQLTVWDDYGSYPQFPNLRSEFTIENIKRIFIHYKVWNSKRNYVYISTHRFGLTIYLTEKQMDKVAKIIKNLNVENVETNQ